MKKYKLDNNTVFNFLKDANWYRLGLYPEVELPKKGFKVAVTQVDFRGYGKDSNNVWWVEVSLQFLADFYINKWSEVVQIAVDFVPDKVEKGDKVIFPNNLITALENPSDNSSVIKDSIAKVSFTINTGYKAKLVEAQNRIDSGHDEDGKSNDLINNSTIPEKIVEDMGKQQRSITASKSKTRILKFRNLTNKFEAVSSGYMMGESSVKCIKGKIGYITYFYVDNPKELSKRKLIMTPMTAYIYSTENDYTQKIYDLNIQSQKEAMSILSKIPLENINLYINLLKNMNQGSKYYYLNDN